MKKSELENGMVVETRDKQRFLVVGDNLLGRHRNVKLEDYNEELWYKYSCVVDIMKVYPNMFAITDYKVAQQPLWERRETPRLTSVVVNAKQGGIIMKIKEGRKYISKRGHIKVEVLFVHEAGILYKLSEDDFVSGCSTEVFLEMYKPITTPKVFRVWKFLEYDTMTSKQKANSLLQGWPLKLEGKTKEEIYPMVAMNPIDDWFVEE